ncbi:MAG: MlaC/ttg2D family ABC transporter substrate-binding protein [Geminicoccaceae bacterium]
MEFSINAVTRRQLFQGATALLGLLAASRGSQAANLVERDAEAAVTRLVDHILQLIQNRADGARQERRLMAAIESQTDLSLLARMTMGRHWRRATTAQQTQFVGLFRRYLLQSFATRLRRYAGADLRAARQRFSILSTKEVGRKDVIVRSRVVPPSGAPLDVDWRLRRRDGRPVIIDLVVEGVSLLITQRSEFGTVLERQGIDGLLDELETRVARSV